MRPLMERLMMLNRMAVLNILIFLTKAATHDHEEHRHEENRQNRRGHHPAHYASTDGVLRAGACAVAKSWRCSVKTGRENRR